MQDKFIEQEIEELMHETAKSQHLDSMQQVLIEDLLERAAGIARCSSLGS